MRQGTLLAGRYLLERRAGAGGMGEVWKAREEGTGQPVAVKLLPGSEPEEAARFAREARILSALDHPRVVRYISHGASDEGALYLVMEWLEGEDLAARLARCPLSLEESMALALHVAETLAFTHARGVMHRDLKPSNLFLVAGRVDGVKVLDFGIARAGLVTRVTRTGAFMGTPGYMAPEQARGEPHVDARVDVFSLGCVLYECLTGAPAFWGAHMAALLTKVLFEEAPSPRRERPEVPEALDALVRRMLAKNRDERPLDGRVTAAALRALGDLRAELPAASSNLSARTPVLTGREQRVAAVILAGAPADAEGQLFESAPTVDLGADAALLHEAAQYGGEGERLADGTVAVVMVHAGLATDLCAQAARCALALRALAGGRSIVLTMARGDPTGRFLGAAIDRGAQLSAAAAAMGAVALDEVVAGLLDARFEVREAEGFFTLHGERVLAENTRLLLGKATPCVGRERELGVLRSLFNEAVEDSSAQAVLVTASPGVGKSRLAQELVQELRARSDAPSIWIARGDALRAGSPFGMLGQVLRSACGIRECDPIEARRERLSAEVAARVGAAERRRVAEFLGEIVGAPFPDEGSLPLRAARRDAQLMADQVRAAFLDFLAGACAERPVLTLLEDLHWGDRPTVLLLDAALRELAERPLFILALARPELRDVFPKLWEGRRFHELRLVELSRRAGERLVQHVMGPGADADMIARIVRLSEGNAFYLEELIRWTAEGRGSDVPETVMAMVESRLSALDDKARRLLRAASTFGEVFWAGGVAALVGGEARQGRVVAGLAALVEREILVRRRDSRFPGEEELAFRHALLREGTYATLTDEDRALGHRLAGAWLEARGEQDARMLAEHFEKGGDAPGAGRHYLRAAQQAILAGSAQESAMLARRGLSLPLSSELRLQLLGALCATTMWQPETAVSVQCEAEELVQIARPGCAPWVQGMIARLNAATVAGRVEEILARMDELRRVDVAPDAVQPASDMLVMGTYTLDLLGRTWEANALIAQLARLIQGFEDKYPFVALHYYIIAAARAGMADDLAGALEHARKSQLLARQSGQREQESAGLLLAMNLWFLGMTDEAERRLRALVLPDEALGIASSYRPWILTWLLADRGAFEEARTAAEHLLALGRTRSMPLDESRGRWVLAEVLRRAGELDAADREVQAAVALLGRVCPLDVPGALATLAALRLAQGRPGEALAAAEEGMARYAAMGMCSHFFRGAFLRLVHVESLDAAGQHKAARAALAGARDRLLAIAAHLSDSTHRKSFLEDVPENRRTLALAREWLTA